MLLAPWYTLDYAIYTITTTTVEIKGVNILVFYTSIQCYTVVFSVIHEYTVLYTSIQCYTPSNRAHTEIRDSNENSAPRFQNPSDFTHQ